MEIEVKDYKANDKVKVSFPDDAWARHHFNKADYNLRMARINFNLNGQKELIRKLERIDEVEEDFNTFEWVIIMSYYAMFHAVQALLRKIGILTGKEHAHEITTNLLLHYFYYTKIIEDEMLKIYEQAEEKAKELVASYVYAKERRTSYQYNAYLEAERKEAEIVLENAADFVSKLKEIEKHLSRELVLARLGRKAL